MDQQAEHDERDRVLDVLEKRRETLIRIAKSVALLMAQRDGEVTSVRLVDELRRMGHGPDLDAHDRRWLGCVFRQGTGWERRGWEPTGSHGRPVARWGRV